MRDPQELVSAYLDDLLAPGELEQLREWLQADPEHKRQFVRASMLHSRVRDLLHEREVRSLFAEADDFDYWVDPGHVASLLDEEAAAAEKRALEAEIAAQRALEAASRRQELLLDRSLLSDPPVQQASWAYAAAAAVVFLALLAGWRSLAQAPESRKPVVVQQKVAPRPAGPTYVGVVTRALQAGRDANGDAIRQGAQLTAGPLTVREGVVELELRTGVRLIVEAPAKLELVSADRVQFDHGRLVAKVPPQAVGFTLRSKAASFVDLGTEFGIQIAESGEADIHVLDGEVALVPSDRKTQLPSRTLQVGEANSVSADGATIAQIPFDAHRFLRRVPSSPYELAVLRSRPLAAWRLYDWTKDAPPVSEGRLTLPAQVNPGIEMTANEIAGGPAAATMFKGAHDGIEAGVDAALGIVSNFTCEAWVLPFAGTNGPQRIYSSFDRPRSGMALGLVNGAWYQLGDNELKVQLTLYGVYDCIGSLPIRPDRWVHLAASVDEQGKPALYVDGQPAELRFRQVSTGADGQRIDHWSTELTPPIGIASAGLTRIGRNPMGSDGAVSPELWQGLINSVAVYDRVLSAEEIEMHSRLARSSVKSADQRRGRSTHNPQPKASARKREAAQWRPSTGGNDKNIHQLTNGIGAQDS